MISFQRVTARYPGSSRNAVDDISFDVGAAELVVLLGPSGCGKSTLLRTVNRLVPLESGRGRRSTEPTCADLDAVELRRGIGYVIQAIGLFSHMTVAQNVAVVPSLLGWSRADIDRTRRRAAADGRPGSVALSQTRIPASSPAARRSASAWREPSRRGRARC